MLIADVKEVKLRRQKKNQTTQSKEAKVKGRARKKYPWKSCFSFLYFKFISAPVLFHFYSVKEVQSVLKTLSISFKITISVSTREKNVCQFTNSAALGISTFALDLAAQICFVLFFQFEFSYLLIKKNYSQVNFCVLYLVSLLVQYRHKYEWQRVNTRSYPFSSVLCCFVDFVICQQKLAAVQMKQRRQQREVLHVATSVVIVSLLVLKVILKISLCFWRSLSKFSGRETLLWTLVRLNACCWEAFIILILT